MHYPSGLSHYTPKPLLPTRGDYHVSPEGDDRADGSFEHPFATIGRAQEAVRSLRCETRPLTVCIHKGIYRTDGMTFTQDDSGSEGATVTYRAYGDGDVVITGGVSIPAASFRPVDEPVRSRLRGPARERVFQADLTALGLDLSDLGPIYPVGAFGTEKKYDAWHSGENCELFFNGRRMRLSRYPSEGFLKLDAVADVGDCFEFPEQNYHFDWNERRNHRGGVYIMDRQTTARLKEWKSLEGIWIYGYFYHDWADSSSPVDHFDLEHRSIFPAWVSRYGARKGGLYRFLNVLDELDSPGEWYLDRASGMLYIYPPEEMDSAVIELTVSQKSLLSICGAHHLVFDGLTLQGARSDAITAVGDHNTFRRLRIRNVIGNGIKCNGYDNCISECEITSTGRGGVFIEGGSRQTLTPGNNIVDNCLIYDYAQVYMMYNPGVRLEGVGNICSHNEIHTSPHMAVMYHGNDHLVEYNYIHDVVTHASDAGAIYSGQDWAGQGCRVRYNCLFNIGSEGFTPDGIYFDDMVSGQSATGNLIIGVRKNGLLIGGGRDITVTGNVIIDCGTPIKYDDRGRDAFIGNGWAKQAVASYETGSMWKRLREVPYTDPVWKERYPRLAAVSLDFTKPDDPAFPPNPSGSTVCENLIVDSEGRIGVIADSVKEYSNISGNAVFPSLQAAGIDPDTYIIGEDTPAKKCLPHIAAIPLHKIGRY